MSVGSSDRGLSSSIPMILRTRDRVPPLSHSVLGLAAGVLLVSLAAPAAAQDLDLREIFTNRGFFAEKGILQGKGEVEFVASVWRLPAASDSTRALIGVSLSNSDLEFARAEGGTWHARYDVVAELKPEDGPTIERRWEESVEVASFDETLMTTETIVFQAEVALAPGTHDLELRVVDRNANQSTRVETEIEALPPSAVALGDPVPLHTSSAEGPEDYVVLPSHSYPAPPDRIEFMAVARASAGSGPLLARARLIEKKGEKETREVASWSDSLKPSADGPRIAFGSFAGEDRYGQYDLEVALVDASGAEIAHARSPLMIAGSATWIAEHWKDALSLIQYEATKDEMEILEDIVDPNERVEAWACFWRMRDPVGTTTINEGMQQYLGRIQTANETWKSALRAGYLSDRGRAFVALGQPDDITSDPFPRGSPPFEVWTYYSGGKQFQLLFVDRIGFNNYELENIDVYPREVSALQRRKRQFLENRAHLCPLLQPAFGSEK